jgi:3-hydroxybutyryl-CoA dehydrogenase
MTTICICGAGTMGTGIAQTSAAAGFNTILYDLNEEVTQKARKKLDKDLDGLVNKQKISVEKKEEIIGRIRFSSNIQDCRAELVIEAIIEKPEIKAELFGKLEDLNSEQTIFASNTSSLSITDLAARMKAPERFVGLHFFNPAPIMKIV